MKVGGKDDSEHLTGDAADIRAVTSRMKFLLIKYGLEAGITRFGVSEKGGFVHLGISPDKPQNVIWTY